MKTLVKKSKSSRIKNQSTEFLNADLQIDESVEFDRKYLKRKYSKIKNTLKNALDQNSIIKRKRNMNTIQIGLRKNISKVNNLYCPILKCN